eukprot:2543842-Prorocentrum_lima.AAC.1
MDTRLLHTYRAVNYYPEGVDPVQHWAISPPCAGLQDLALQLRVENPKSAFFKIPESYRKVHDHTVA